MATVIRFPGAAKRQRTEYEELTAGYESGEFIAMFVVAIRSDGTHRQYEITSSHDSGPVPAPAQSR